MGSRLRHWVREYDVIQSCPTRALGQAQDAVEKAMKKARRRAEQRMRHCSGPLIRSRTVTSPASQMSATRRTTCCRRRIRTKTTERHLGSGRCIVGTREHNANSVGPSMPEPLNVPAANEATGPNLPLHVGQLHWRNRGRRIRARVRTQPLPQSTACHAMRALQLTTRHATDRAQRSMRCDAQLVRRRRRSS